MKYLLLGGAGFIGSTLARRLINDGHDVTIVDSLVTSLQPTFDVKFIKADIRFFDVENLIQECDIVYFLAGSVGVAHIDQHPTETLDNNLGLMNKLIPLFEKYQKKVIFSSTSEVYGDGPFAEHNNLSIGPPTKLRWAYAAAKLMTEFKIFSSSFPFIIYRYFNVVGPGQLGDYGMVLPRFIQAAKNNQDLTVYGNGEQVRSFCHVDDAVDIMLELEPVNNEIFNLGNDQALSIMHLANKVIEISQSKSKIQTVPYETAFSKHHGDIIHRIPDLTKLRRFSSHQLKYNINDIIKDCL
jgi:UDP-glucose 4-epimerase